MGRVGRDRSQREGVDRPRPGGQRRTAGTGCRCVAVPWRLSRQRRHSGREPVHWCSPTGVGSLSMTSSCGGCCASLGLQPCRTVSAPASGTGAGEETDHPREVIEAALAHVVRNRVEAAYARSDLFERQRTLMDDWARYLAQGIGCPPPGPARRPRPGQARDRATPEGPRPSRPG